MDAEVGHHGLAVAVADGGDNLLVLGAGELVEKDAVGRLVDAEAPDVADDVGDGMLDLVVGAAEGVVEVAAGATKTTVASAIEVWFGNDVDKAA